MSLPIHLEKAALDDADEAVEWHENQRVGLGAEFLDDLDEQLERIQDNPELYAILYRKVRASPFQRFSYVIYYRIQTDRISVIAIQHSRRDPRIWRRRA